MDSQKRITLSSITDQIPLAIVVGCLGIMVLGAVFLIGLGIGFGVGRLTATGLPARNATASASTDLYQCTEQPRGPAASRLCPEFDLFWEAMDLLYKDYYGDLPDSEDAAYQAIRGVISLLDDPNTSFLTPDEADYFRSNLEGSFEGIGARVGWDEEADTLIITEPFENQPAWQAGLRRNDLILAVDGESIVGTNLSEAVRKIRGPKDSVVTLTVQRPGVSSPFDLEVTRDAIHIPTISVSSLGEAGDIAYVRLNSFSENAGRLVRESVRDAVDRDSRAIILDLRGNTGGLLREAVKVASIFLDDKVVLLERFNDGTVETYRTEGKPIASDIPLVVLVDEGSASASEIVAGALQDHGRAALIGTTTFGKGSVQLPETLSNGGIMRITIARWFTPNDRTIDGVGLEPDITIEPLEGEAEGVDDPTLDAALKYLTDNMDNP